MTACTWTFGEHGFYFKPLTRFPEIWKQEVYNTAKLIRNNTDRKIFVCMSGGIDSEIVARSFYDQDIDFSAVILEYDNELNTHDISYAKNFCQQRNIKTHIIKINLINFIELDIPNYIKSGYYATNIFRFIQRRLIEEVELLNGCAVLGGGEQIFVGHNNEVCLTKSLDAWSSVQFAQELHTNHCVEFFMHNPEIQYAWMCEPIIEIMTANSEYYPVDLKMSIEKIIIYHRYWNEMIHRKKYSGYEKIQSFREQVEKKLKTQFTNLIQYHIPISKIKNDLLKNLN
jgi:hypothetical protein